MMPVVEHGWYTRCLSIDENWLPSHSSNRMPMTLQLEVGLCSHLHLYAGVLTGLCRSCARCYSLWVCMCIYRVCMTSIEVIHLSWLSEFFCPLFCIDPLTLREECHGAIPYGSVFQCLFFCGSVLIIIYIEKKLLWWGMIYGHRIKSIGVILLLCPKVSLSF